LTMCLCFFFSNFILFRSICTWSLVNSSI
jgi:hypothetical protein